jgi:ADP-ribose pyrophosphatase
MKLEEKTLDSRLAFQGKILYATQDEVSLPDGTKSLRDVIHHSGGVGILPLTEEGDIYMVRQYRYPHHTVTLEIPAGKREEGEEPLDCGIRELREETGCISGKITDLGELLPTPAYDTEVIHMYLAEDIKRVGDQSLDNDEFINLEKVPLKKAVSMVMRGEIRDAKTVAAVLKTWYIKQG